MPVAALPTSEKKTCQKDCFRKGPPNVDMKVLVQLPNPYNWPIISLNIGLRYNGERALMAPVKDDPLTRCRKIRNLPMRKSDIILAAFPKCGTHWTTEMINMLLSGSTDYLKEDKMDSMIEFIDDLEALESIGPSPRLFNSHLYFAHLPKEVVNKKVKIVHVIRNPKDVAVSWFHHLRQLLSSNKLTFDNFLKGYMESDYSMWGHQFDYLRQFSQFQTDHPDHPIKQIHYEDLKQDPVSVLRDLAKFLNLPDQEELYREITVACGFKKLRVREDLEKGDANSFRIFRKGVIGDWKNSFTVAQNETFNEFMQEQLKMGFGFTLNDTKTLLFW